MTHSQTGIGWPAVFAVVAAVSVVTFSSTLYNGFLLLGFDDRIILDTPALRSLDGRSLWAMATQFNEAHYVPLTMLSFAIDHQLWGLDPLGYHLTNILLHAANAVLLLVFLRRFVPNPAVAIVATLLFAVHPLQMESVSLAIQRKTVLSASGFFLALIFYQNWWSSGRKRHYLGAFLAFLAAALAKPIVVTLPVVLLLYEYVFVRRRPTLQDKLPFLAVAAAVTWAATAAHSLVGAIHPPHGGALSSHLLMVARVALESVTAIFVPLNLSPIYYYPRAVAYSWVNFASIAVIAAACSCVSVRRRIYPWSFFCLAWWAITFLPESNLVPLAQLRADRFAYLPMVGATLWIALCLERLARRASFSRTTAYAATTVLVAVLASMTHFSAGIWRNDVSAWTRVALRHPWAGVAHTMLGRAYVEQGNAPLAEAAFLESLQRKEDLPDTHLQLARLYHDHGANDRARKHLRRFLELAPDNPEGRELLAVMGP